MTARKKTAEYHEGPEATRRFEDTLGRILKVSKDELEQRKNRGAQKKSTSRLSPSKKT